MHREGEPGWRLDAERERGVERGIAFLAERQGGDGLWHDFRTLAGEASDWPTGVIVAELAHVGAPREPLERSADALLATQQHDGGWGYHGAVPTDADSTACVLLALVAVGRDGRGLQRGAACLARHQEADSGGLATYREPGAIRDFMGLGPETDLRGWCSPHMEVTATGGRAFAGLTGEPFGALAYAAWDYVRRRQRTDGSWNSYWWASPDYPTHQAVELAHAVGDRAAVHRAAKWALRRQAADGSWSAPGATTSAFATALSLSVLLRCGRTDVRVDCAIERLIALQDADGSWPSHPIMRIPPPHLLEPASVRSWRDGLGTGVVVADQHRTFTTSACVAALALAAIELP